MSNKKLIGIIIALVVVIAVILGVLLSKNLSPNNDGDRIQQSTAPQVNSIFLSKNELSLGVDETFSLVATVSPSTAETTLKWTSSDKTIAEVSDNGMVTTKKEGNVVIKVEAPNGVLALCNVEVKIKTGTVTGTITYKYNNYVGHKPDTDSKVMLIPKSVKSLDDGVALGLIYSLPDGCYGTKVDGSGKYTFDDVPVGDYYLVIISDNTNSGSYSGSLYWGPVYNMFSNDGKNTANNTCWLHKIKYTSVTVSEGKTVTFSHDFGITYT